jgi:hypothetical protein
MRNDLLRISIDPVSKFMLLSVAFQFRDTCSR